MAETTRPFTSRCAVCDKPINYLGQSLLTEGPLWLHEVGTQPDHLAQPELRFAIDATCPGCEFPEIGYAPARGEFVCSRCGHTTTERPKD